MPKTKNCAACGKNTHLIERLQCFNCKMLYHYECLNITREQYATEKHFFDHSWKCPECNLETRTVIRDDTPVRRSSAAMVDITNVSVDELMSANCEVTNYDTLTSDKYFAHSQDMANVTVRAKLNNRTKTFHSDSPTAIADTTVREGLKEVIYEEMQKAITANFASLRVLFSDKIEEVCQRLKNLEENVNRTNRTNEQIHSLGNINNYLELNFGKLDERLTSIEKKMANKIIHGETQNTHSQNLRVIANPQSTIKQNKIPEKKSIDVASKTIGNEKTPGIKSLNNIAKTSADILKSQPEIRKGNTEDSKWTDVKSKHSKGRRSQILRGTADPCNSLLQASEKVQYLHLYYVKMGTSDIEVNEHLKKISKTDTCTVETLKARGNYASFKLGVPTRLVDTVLMPTNWAADICIKPWRQIFRAKHQAQ